MSPNIGRKTLVKGEKKSYGTGAEVLPAKYHMKLFMFSPGHGTSMTRAHVHDPWICHAHTEHMRRFLIIFCMYPYSFQSSTRTSIQFKTQDTLNHQREIMFYNGLPCTCRKGFNVMLLTSPIGFVSFECLQANFQ